MTFGIAKAGLRCWRDERGLTTVEYVICLCLIAALAVTTWQKFGGQVQGHLKTSADSIDAELNKKPK